MIATSITWRDVVVILFHAACDRDLEGIVGKPAHSPYVEQPSPWIKVLNPGYSQKVDRHDLFERRVSVVPVR